jgi:antitoxin VapB
MYAVEFETDITGDTVKIPAHLLNRIPNHGQVKIILLLPEKEADKHSANLKSEILKIGEKCSALPLLDSRTPDEILGYEKNGLPT